MGLQGTPEVSSRHLLKWKDLIKHGQIVHLPMFCFYMDAAVPTQLI